MHTHRVTRILGAGVVALALSLTAAPAAEALAPPGTPGAPNFPHAKRCGWTKTVHQWSYQLPQPDGTIMVVTNYVKKRKKCHSRHVITITGSTTSFIPAPAPPTPGA